MISDPLKIAASAGSLGRSDRGSASVEAAFIMPLLFTLTIGAIEIGRAMSIQATIRHAVQETARFATVHGFASGAEATVTELETMASGLAGLAADSMTVDAVFVPDNRPGSEVSVSIEHAYIPLTSAVFDFSGFTLSSSTTLTMIR